jgi:hypothetical protein
MTERRLDLTLTRKKDGYQLSVSHRAKDGGPDKSETRIEHEKDQLTASQLTVSAEEQVTEFLSRCGDDEKEAVEATPIGRAAK